MSKGSLVKRALESLGRDNNPAYVVVAIATAKGIFRPLFTMMDKKESPETKKYTALREGLTEVIAIPTYITCSALAGKGAKLVKDPKMAEIAKHNLQFIGVCTAALVAIPGLCSMVIKPFTDKIFHKNKKEEPARLDVTSKTAEIDTTKTQITQTGRSDVKQLTPIHNVSISGFTNSGMRVG
ncbi:hypothetical protein HDR58_06935 [bacterium]|nr:hypothetical protein [bacterium]